MNHAGFPSRLAAVRPGFNAYAVRVEAASRLTADLDESEAAAAESSWTVGYLDVLLLLLTLFAILLGVGYMQKGDPPKRTARELDLSLQVPAPPAPPALAVTLDPRVLLTVLQSRLTPPPPAKAPEAEPSLVAAVPAPPAPVQEPAKSPVPPASALITTPEPRPSAAMPVATLPPAMERLARTLAAKGGELLELSLSDKELRIELRDDILFPPGSADLGGEGQGLLKRLAELLISQGARISVEGHTDDLPIATKRFPSNWELSLYRASSVARQLIELGIPAERVQATGFADTRPRAPNDSPDHRARNGRVSLVLHLVEAEPAATAAAPQLVRPGPVHL
jgi:chemotaxis protein MotB